MKLTPRERKILHIAQFQADIPIHEIARQAGMREHTVRHCIGSLLSRGIVEPVTLINLTALGFTEYLLYFSLAPVSAERRRSILKTILETESVSWASRVSGEYQFAVLLVVKSQLEIRLFLERLSDQNGEIFGRKAFSALNSWNYYPCSISRASNRKCASSNRQSLQTTTRRITGF
jgi:DNA-binding Lrp family transcriptional regulator